MTRSLTYQSSLAHTGELWRDASEHARIPSAGNPRRARHPRPSHRGELTPLLRAARRLVGNASGRVTRIEASRRIASLR